MISHYAFLVSFLEGCIMEDSAIVKSALGLLFVIAVIAGVVLTTCSVPV